MEDFTSLQIRKTFSRLRFFVTLCIEAEKKCVLIGLKKHCKFGVPILFQINMGNLFRI